MMRAVGEMLTKTLSSIPLSTLSHAIWVGLGLFLGLCLTGYPFVFIGMAEITAISHYVQFWGSLAGQVG